MPTSIDASADALELKKLREREYFRTYARKRREDPEYRAKHNAVARKSQKKKRETDPAWVSRRYKIELQRIRARKQQAVEYMGGKCSDCHTVYPAAVYDFHHLNPAEKDMDPQKALRATWDKARVELDKCVLLCANCHRIRHFVSEEDATS